MFPLNVTSIDFLNIASLLTAFKHRAACLLLHVSMQLRSSVVDEGLTHQEAWNDALLPMARASRAHASYLLLRDFHDGLNTEAAGHEPSSSSCLGPDEIVVLRQCLTLLGLYWMDKFLDDFLEIGCLQPEHVSHMRRAYLKILTIVRPSAVGLCDARDFSDFRLKSALGRYDGDVYPAIMDAAQRDPLNHAGSSGKNGGGGVGLGYEESLKRLIVGRVGEYRGSANTGGIKSSGLSGTLSRL